MMCTIDRVRIKHPDGTFSVRDYAFSQVVELTAPLTREDNERFYNRECVVLPLDTHFAKAGSELKYMGEV